VIPCGDHPLGPAASSPTASAGTDAGTRNATEHGAGLVHGRKRNVDGGVPPMGLMTEPLMFLKRSDSRADARLKDHP